jgi:hypothetical protein
MIHTQGGRVYEGVIVEQNETTVTIQLSTGTVQLPREAVTKIEKQPTRPPTETPTETPPPTITRFPTSTPTETLSDGDFHAGADRSVSASRESRFGLFRDAGGRTDRQIREGPDPQGEVRAGLLCQGRPGDS